MPDRSLLTWQETGKVANRHDFNTDTNRDWQAVTRWFRFYADAMRNPKVAALSDAEFRLWVELLAVASENDGHIPPAELLKHVLKRRLDHLLRGLEGLLRALLIDPLSDGYEPHNWAKFQYKSDVSTDRVQKHRAKRNVSVTPPDTETDTEGVIAKAITPRARKATRIAEGWRPGLLPANVLALIEQWPQERAERALAEFADYWTARQRDAARTDWDKVWHNRIRDIHDRVMRESKNGKATDKRDGIARALDRRLGFGEPARTAGRPATGDGQADRCQPLALAPPMQ